jgi:NO-binding membrane sensor protein with MHYT domain
MPEVHQFAYGLINPIASFTLAFIGSLLALACSARARETTRRDRRARWLIIASVALGGAIWLMHFVAMIGFDVPASPVRYGLGLTAGSALVAVLVTSIGMLVVGFGGPRSLIRILLGGVFTGAGIAVMHYTGMAAMRVSGSIGYDVPLVAASVLIAVVAATVALWFSLTIRGWPATVLASIIMAIAVCAMHYTGMAALRVHLDTAGEPVRGINPILLVLPITVVSIAALVGLVLSALPVMTEEEFSLTADFDRTDRPGKHAPAEPEPAPAGTAAGQPHPVSLAEFTEQFPAVRDRNRQP